MKKCKIIQDNSKLLQSSKVGSENFDGDLKTFEDGDLTLLKLKSILNWKISFQ